MLKSSSPASSPSEGIWANSSSSSSLRTFTWSSTRWDMRGWCRHRAWHLASPPPPHRPSTSHQSSKAWLALSLPQGVFLDCPHLTFCFSEHLCHTSYAHFYHPGWIHPCLTCRRGQELGYKLGDMIKASLAKGTGWYSLSGCRFAAKTPSMPTAPVCNPFTCLQLSQHPVDTGQVLAQVV